MSNSKLVSYTKWSPNWSTRNGAKIDRIAIHHMAGNLSLETCGKIFSDGKREASSTYGIDSNGKVGQYVDESRAPWTTCNYSECDRFAVTIEVANDQIGGDWHVSDKALATLIDLCVDVCQRNSIPKLNYTGDKSGNLLMHCWYWATACPGPYLKSKFGYIADEVNKRLADAPKPKITVDGLFGEESTRALQRYLDCYVDGEISGQIKSLHKYFPNIRSCTWEESGSACIVVWQEFLKNKGCNPGDIDGILGEKTIKAWQTFLVKEGYDTGGIDGIFGPASAKAMQDWLNKQ